MIFFNRPSVEDLYEFCYLWQMYDEFGITSQEAVAEYEKSAEKPAVRDMMHGLQNEMRKGASIAEAMQQYPDFFPAYMVEMIRVGEQSGQMGKILSTLVFMLGLESDIKKDVLSALWSPLFVIITVLVAFIASFYWVIPQMGDLFAELGIELPWFTKLIVGVGNFLANYWFLLLALLMLSCFGLYSLMKTRPYIKDRIQLHLPFFGKVHKTQIQFRLASVLGMCSEANVQLPAAIRFAADASGSYFMRETLMAALRRMEASGMSFSDALQIVNTYDMVSHRFCLMLRVGANGNLGEIMLHLAEREQKDLVRYSKEIGDKVSLFVITPASIILALIYLAVDIPLYSAGSNITNF